jgi:hypothetical protein
MVDETVGLTNFGTHQFFLKTFFSMRILNLKLKLLLLLVLPLAACYVEYLYGHYVLLYPKWQMLCLKSFCVEFLSHS